MAPERRSRRGHRSGRQARHGPAADPAVSDAETEVDAGSAGSEPQVKAADETPRSAAQVEAGAGSGAGVHGTSILKEIFPDHGKEEVSEPVTKAKVAATHNGKSLLQHLLHIPSPARAPRAPPPAAPPTPVVGPTTPSSLLSGTTTTPQPPTAAPMMPLSPPTAPLATTLLPLSAPQRPHQEQWMPPSGAPVATEGFASYRDKLRAGGHMAFHRAQCAGFMPKGLKGTLPPTPQHSEASPVWATAEVQGGAPFTQSSWYGGNADMMPQPQAHQMMPPMGPPMQPAALPMPPQMPPQMPSQLAPAQMPQAPAHHQQPLMPPQHPAVTPTIVAGQVMTTAPAPSTPMAMVPPSEPAPTYTEFDRCMAIAMPQAASSGYNKDAIAAQLRAVADCQCYED